VQIVNWQLKGHRVIGSKVKKADGLERMVVVELF